MYYTIIINKYNKNLQANDRMAFCDVLFNVALDPLLLNIYTISCDDTIASLKICGCQDKQRTLLVNHDFVLLISGNNLISEPYNNNLY